MVASEESPSSKVPLLAKFAKPRAPQINSVSCLLAFRLLYIHNFIIIHFEAVQQYTHPKRFKINEKDIIQSVTQATRKKNSEFS